MSSGPKSKASTLLETVVEENRQVVDEIKEAADELMVVHAVLATETSKVPASGDVKEAVQRTEEVKSMLDATASKLEDATGTLEQHVSAQKKTP